MQALKSIFQRVLSFRFIMAFMVFCLFPLLFVSSVLYSFQNGDSTVILGAFVGAWICLFLFLLAVLNEKGSL